MVYTHDLKSCGASLVGSSPTPGTTKEKGHLEVTFSELAFGLGV